MSETKAMDGGKVTRDLAAVSRHTIAVNRFATEPTVIELAKLDVSISKYLLGNVRQLTCDKSALSALVATRQRVEAALGLVVTLDAVKAESDRDEAMVATNAQIVLSSIGLLDITSQIVGDVIGYCEMKNRECPDYLVSIDDVYTVLTASQEKAIEDSKVELTIPDYVSIVRIAASVIRGVKGREGADTTENDKGEAVCNDNT
ncbi:MAG: hypothetical protein GY832_01510 [Chloroflexi bacterium]|nr:hypothetical protein [Chloroflexota bacterium]